MKSILTTILLLVFLPCVFGAPTPDITAAQNEIVSLSRGRAGTLCVAALDLVNGTRIGVNADKHCPIDDIYRLPLILCVLDAIDRGQWTLENDIRILPDDLRPNVPGPIRERYVNGSSHLTMEELLRYTFLRNDDNGSDILYKMLRGPRNVNIFVHNLGIADIDIVNTEEAESLGWSVQYNNWATANSMVELMRLIDANRILKPKSRRFLLGMMAQDAARSIQNKLPAGTTVIHKNAFSGYNKQGQSAAVNDIGIMVSPKGDRIAYAILISDSTEKREVNEALIARVGRIIYDANVSETTATLFRPDRPPIPKPMSLRQILPQPAAAKH